MTVFILKKDVYGILPPEVRGPMFGDGRTILDPVFRPSLAVRSLVSK